MSGSGTGTPDSKNSSNSELDNDLYHSSIRGQSITSNRNSLTAPSSSSSSRVTITHTSHENAQQRPSIRPQSPGGTSLHHSTSSILTMSKLYQQQQQSGRISPVTSNRQSPMKSHSGFGLSSKKLHKRVLSSSSLTGDYFSNTSNSRETSPLSEPVHNTVTSPGPRLPTFKRMDSFQQQIPEDPNNTSITRDEIEPSLSSSKIYERRKAKEEDDNNKEEIDDDSAVDEQTHEVLVKKYEEKLNKMKGAEKKKRVEFYNSDTDSDVDIHSDDENLKDKKTESSQHSNSTTSGDSTVTDEKHVKSDKEDEEQDEEQENKPSRFKSILRRMTIGEEEDDLPERLKRQVDEEDEDHENGFFSKFVNLSGGGLIPGASKSERKKSSDEEAQNDKEEDGIQMQNLDPEIFKKEAHDIIQAHASHSTPSKSKYNNQSDEATLKDSSSSMNDSFLAPNPDLYLRDEDNIFEMNLDSNDASYIAPPEKVRGGVLSSLLKLYQNPTEASRSRLSLTSEGNSPVNSNLTTPIEERDEFINSSSLAGRLKNFAGGKKKVAIDDGNLQEQQDKIHKHRKHASFTDASQIKDAAENLLSPNFMKGKKTNSSANLPSFSKTPRPKMNKMASGLIKTKKEQAKARITVHIAETLQRQRFILRMCKALMLYGAPTHRLEEYLTMTARVLEIDAQFIYLPGCMIISFGDATTRTSEVQLVRCAQGLNLYKLHRVHRIYKRVIHDLVGVEEASTQLDELLAANPQFSPWVCVLIYALSSAMVTPFAFGGGWVNLPVSFGIGGCVGILQFLIAPRSNLYSNVFEVTASIVVAFIGRALGSINGSHICFSAVVQGSLALILPGYIILCGSLELQSRNLVAGSVRMFYAIIYSLFLGFGITMGAAIYGWIDKNATSDTTCSEKISPWFNFLFVPAFTVGLALINQAKWFQIPIMVIISGAGYVVNYFASKHFYDSTEFTSAMGAFVIGVLGNLYSRLWQGIAVSAMLPAIFVQVPSGIASQSTLLTGVQSANKLVSNSTSSTSSSSNSGLGFGLTMVQVAIGISVGLFASTIAVYPFGKKATSVFTL